MQHHCRILADRIEHDRPLRLRDGFAEDVKAFGFEPVEMGEWLQQLVPSVLRRALPLCAGEGKTAALAKLRPRAEFGRNRPISIHR
jgi:hypothetical protein